MKNKLFLIIVILAAARLLHANPIAGVSGISGNTERASTLALIMEQRILDILKKNTFGTIDPAVISRELSKFNCVEEKCILKFAEDADIDLIVRGIIKDKKTSINIKLESYGIKIPFNKRIITRYEITIPLDVSIGSREFSLIAEEHAAEFTARTLDIFLFPVAIKASADKYTLPDNSKISGRFTIYSKNSYGSTEDSGEADISDGNINLIRGKISAGESFILQPFKDRSIEIRNYYRTRKREIVFGKTSFYDTMLLFAATPVASASMPFSSLFLGYYTNNDWKGLGLWALNAPPYLYIEARGLINSPAGLKDKRKDISRDDRAMNYFAWYMVCAGGMPLFVDSYASSYIHRASYFTGNTGLMGNTATAAMLSLTGNGAGLFYRGNRYWGYFYFHLNNILLYMTIREFSAPEKYDEASGIYTKKSTNKTKGMAIGSVFLLSKTIEIIHAVAGKEDLSSGETTDGYILPEPVFTLDSEGEPVFGVNVSLKF